MHETSRKLHNRNGIKNQDFENIRVISPQRIADTIKLNNQTHPARSMTVFTVKLIVLLK